MVRQSMTSVVRHSYARDAPFDRARGMGALARRGWGGDAFSAVATRGVDDDDDDDAKGDEC